jgi:hypothetical protein
VSDAIAPAESRVIESVDAIVLVVSVPTTPVETTSLTTTPWSVGVACGIGGGVPLESGVMVAVAESAVATSSAGRVAGESSLMRNAPMPRLTNAAMPTPFQT